MRSCNVAVLLASCIAIFAQGGAQEEWGYETENDAAQQISSPATRQEFLTPKYLHSRQLHQNFLDESVASADYLLACMPTTKTRPSTWPENYKECGGDAQSPIALSRRQAHYKPRKSPYLSYQMYGYDVKPLNLTLSNNGHTVAATFNYGPAGNAPYVQHRGVSFSENYYLEALHFHWGSNDRVGSEHTVDGYRFPIEMHMVHERLSNGTGGSDEPLSRYLVIGYMLTECDRSGRALATLTDALPAVVQPGSSAQLRRIPPGQFMAPPQVRNCDLFTYRGSLTTPPCTQSVTWLVDRWPLCITDQQLEAFRSLRTTNGEPLVNNYRPLQPTNDRPVFYINCFY